MGEKNSGKKIETERESEVTRRKRKGRGVKGWTAAPQTDWDER